MKFPRAADDTCTSFGATAKQMALNQSATLKLPGSDLQIKLEKKGLDSNYTDKTKYASHKERDGETKEGTLSLCRKTAAASRDEDNPDTNKMETLFLKVRISIFGNHTTPLDGHGERRENPENRCDAQENAATKFTHSRYFY
jgi:hypothetical protein